MKKWVLLILTMTLLFAGCAKDEPSADWEQIICDDFQTGESILEQEIAKAVVFEVKQKEEQLLVTVTAPNICDSMMAWVDAIPDEDFTEEALEAELLRQLATSEKVKTEHLLTFSNDNEQIQIHYTAEFADSMDCGLNRFYAELTQKVLEELQEVAG